jgi:hypothetical protein
MRTCGLEGIFYSYEPRTSITDPSPVRLDPVSIDFVRQRLRWLWILWDGIRRNPVLVPSGEQEPRPVTRTIVHPGQTYADAINEFAAKLVTPPARYVAQVKSPQGYSETQLLEALGAGDFLQVFSVREWSRAVYSVTQDNRDEPVTSPFSPEPPSPRPPVIRRGADTHHSPPPSRVESDPAVEEKPEMPETRGRTRMPGPANRAKRKRYGGTPPGKEAVVVEAEDTGRLAIQPADVVVEAELLFDDVADATAAAVSVAPPAGLCLGHYLTADVFSEAKGGWSFEMLQTYVWAEQENFERAASWLHAGRAGGRPDNSEAEFFARNVRTLYHYDRALGAARDNERPPPVSGTQVPYTLGDSPTLCCYERFEPLDTYCDTPLTIVDTIAAFVRNTPNHDGVRRSRYSPLSTPGSLFIVHAQFGSWVVEVCSWKEGL